MDDFEATAEPTVDFGVITGTGTAAETVDGFTVNGERGPWSVALRSAHIGSDGAIALIVRSINDNEGDTLAARPPTCAALICTQADSIYTGWDAAPAGSLETIGFEFVEERNGVPLAVRAACSFATT